MEGREPILREIGGEVTGCTRVGEDYQEWRERVRGGVGAGEEGDMVKEQIQVRKVKAVDFQKLVCERGGDEVVAMNKATSDFVCESV